MPMFVFRDFIQLTKWEIGGLNSNLGAEWVLKVPEEAHLDYISSESAFPFYIDLEKSIIYFVVIFSFSYSS